MPRFATFDRRKYRTVSAREGYAQWAATYEDTIKRDMDLWLLGEIQSVTWSAVGRCADLGCGTGRTAAWLTSKGVKVIDGVDATPEMLDQARTRGVFESIRQAEGLEHAPCASLIQHLGRGINPIDHFYALARQPCGSAPRSATEIRAALDGTPGDALDLAEQPQIHITLYGVLVGRGPLSVTFTRRHGAVLASIKYSEVRHINKLVPTCSCRTG